MKPAPKWVQDLTLKTLVQFAPNGDVPFLITRNSYGEFSSGSCHDEVIRLNIGRDRTDAKLVLLHELCHWVRPKISKTYGHGQYARTYAVCEGHTDAFWDLCWAVYRWAGLPMRYCYKRESSYKIGAIKAYKRLKKKEA